MTTGKCNTCSDPQSQASSGPAGQGPRDAPEGSALESRMNDITHKILVLSGKGGVGKSTVAVNLAAALAMAGKRVGLLDVDIHGPSVPKLLHLEGAPVTGEGNTLYPIKVRFGAGVISVMSIGFLLQGRDDAIIWRGPRKYGVIKQFLTDVDWGRLDYLVVDSPPGTGDEPLAVAELIGKADGAVVVTTPQALSVQDVRRCVTFCREIFLPVVGVIENMSGFTCPKCGEVFGIFGQDGGSAMAEEMGVPFLGAIPIDPSVVATGDNGTPMVDAHPHSEAAKGFGRIVRRLLDAEPTATPKPQPGKDGHAMRIAIPVTGGVLSSHFGHCERFVLFDVDGNGKRIGDAQELTPPPHEPGTFPKWLHEQGATVIIAGGMGSRAESLFRQNDIEVVVGANGREPEAIVRRFLDGRLETGANICDH
jgi:ATP-binding protein involved in chromosome partitioning